MIEWTYEQSKLKGWYWAVFHNYEIPELIYLDRMGKTYCVGLEYKNSPIHQILKWSKEPLEIPNVN